MLVQTFSYFSSREAWLRLDAVQVSSVYILETVHPLIVRVSLVHLGLCESCSYTVLRVFLNLFYLLLFMFNALVDR